MSLLVAGRGSTGFAQDAESLATPPEYDWVDFDLDEPGPGVSGATVFGADGRVPIDDTTEDPWRSIAHLLVIGGDGSLWECSGTMLSPSVLLTAAHCVYDSDVDLPAVVISVTPGADGDLEPYGSTIALDFSVPQGYLNGGEVGSPFDIALVYLDDSPFGSQTGPFLSLYAAPNPFLASINTILSSAGYPGDKPFATMWFSAELFYSYNSTHLLHTMDMAAGQSGSAVIAVNTQVPMIAIVGVVSAEGAVFNYSVRLTTTNIQAMQSWCASRGCTLPVIATATSPTSTPTRTPTRTATATPTRSMTPSPTITATRTPTISQTPTKTVSATPTRTTTPTTTASPTPQGKKFKMFVGGLAITR